MKNNIVLLHLEDDDNDAKRVKSLIDTDNLNCKIIRIKDSREFTQHVNDNRIHLILSELKLLDFEGLNALKLIRSKNKHIPFIFLSDELNQNILLSAMHYGATDYILKNDIANLGKIIRNAVKNYTSILEAEELNRQIEKNHERYNAIHKAVNDVIWEIDLQKNQVIWSDNATEIFRIKQKELGNTLDWFVERIHPDESGTVSSKLEQLLSDRKEKLHLDFHFKCGDGNYAYLYFRAYVFYDKDKRPVKIIGSLLDCSDIKKMRDELMEAKHIAEESEKIKSEFLAQMSHEIRTPLNIILNFAEMLKEDYNLDADDDKREIYSIMQSSGMRLIRTVDSVLSISQLNAGTYKPTFKTLNLYSDVLERLYKEYRQSAQSKKLLLILKKTTDLDKIITDDYCVTQIFSNLIDNAIKYTKKGKVEILLGRNGHNRLYVEIHDTGIGISEDFLPHVFDSFRREEMGYTRRCEGNGLGLSLVKNYCAIINAEISVQSKKDVGTKFRVVFR